MIYTRRIAHGSAYVFGGTLIAGFLGYLIRIVLAKNLTPAEYGLFYAVFAFVAFFMFFRGFGLNEALVRYVAQFSIAKKYDKIKTIIASTLVWQTVSSLVFGILLFAFSDFLAANYFKDAAASLMLKLFVIYVFFSMAFFLLQSILQGFQKIKIFSAAEPLRNAVNLILIFVFIKLGFKVLSPVYAFTLSWLIMSLFLLPFFMKTFDFFKYKITEFGKTTKMLFKFGMPVLFTAIGGSFIARIDTLMLTYFVTLDQVGIYNVVMPTAIIFLFFSGSVGAVAYPIISELWAKNDKQRLTDWMRLLYKYLFVFVTPVLLAMFAFSELFIKIFFGQAYTSGAMALQILLVGVLFFILANLNNTTISAMGKPEIVTKIVILAVIVTFFANLILIPHFGINGAAVATALSYLAVLVFSTYEVARMMEMKVPIIPWIKTLFASLVFVFVIYAMKNILAMNVWAEAFISGAIAVIVYAGLVYLLKLVDIEEIKKYLRLVMSLEKNK
jgi:O-antigen/teichoic acid export membrane protein